MKYQFLYIQDVLSVHLLVLHCAKFVLVVLAGQIRQPLFHPKHEKRALIRILITIKPWSFHNNKTV